MNLAVGIRSHTCACAYTNHNILLLLLFMHIILLLFLVEIFQQSAVLMAFDSIFFLCTRTSYQKSSSSTWSCFVFLTVGRLVYELKKRDCGKWASEFDFIIIIDVVFSHLLHIFLNYYRSHIFLVPSLLLFDTHCEGVWS